MTTNVKLMVVLGKLNNVFINRLGKDLEGLGMPASIYPILAHLNEVDRAKTGKLGEVAIITSGTITHIVNKMVKEGLVRKIQDENDRRVFWVEITELGRSKFQVVHKKHMVYLDSLLNGFNEEQKLEFIQMIKHFGKTMEGEL
jgi:MarR family 2-MHQ and catechol resistance regulon transcriptional repressor